MAISHDRTDSTATAIVSVRIPSSGDDLTTDAENRLARTDGVVSVAVDGLRGLEPGLSATVVTVEVTITLRTDVARGELRERLAAAPGVENVSVP
ncbi:hypothetical protein SAMN05216559_1807 [Halomicrobium zhouii]|uniref:Uncharacterized protein n=1 Tax=Halomicrobium zhouii TaxID=767519 RepID=A0A1I6L173_9EURY|nr:hypothetical protein [Halomicrobium zhouii]SFR97195.1 hypothetical protein SAMN05216559_1807 [Halomicrobium zhouii]